MPADPAQADREFERRFARVEGLLTQLSACADPSLGQAARELLATVLELHQRGLSRLLALTTGDSGLPESLLVDPRVSAMLLLHGLHPLALETRVARAVQVLRERFRSKLEDVTFDARDGVITLSLLPAANSCGSTRAALKKDFEDALLAAAPDAESVHVECSEPSPSLVTLRRSRDERTERWQGSSR